jgi:hypothetical protein
MKEPEKKKKDWRKIYYAQAAILKKMDVTTGGNLNGTNRSSYTDRRRNGF